MQQIVLLLSHAGDTSCTVDMQQKAPWLEAGISRGDITISELKDSTDMNLTQKGGGRRIFKTHAPYQLMPCKEWLGSGAKCIYVARNPKDAAVSAFYHNRGLPKHEYDGPWEHFVSDIYLQGKLEHGCWWEHMREWWLAYERHPAQILWVTYEELKQDPTAQIKRIAQFLPIDCGDELVEKVIAGSSFDAMKQASSKAQNSGPMRKKVQGQT